MRKHKPDYEEIARLEHELGVGGGIDADIPLGGPEKPQDAKVAPDPTPDPPRARKDPDWKPQNYVLLDEKIEYAPTFSMSATSVDMETLHRIYWSPSAGANLRDVK